MCYFNMESIVNCLVDHSKNFSMRVNSKLTKVRNKAVGVNKTSNSVACVLVSYITSVYF